MNILAGVVLVGAAGFLARLARLCLARLVCLVFDSAVIIAISAAEVEWFRDCVGMTANSEVMY